MPEPDWLVRARKEGRILFETKPTAIPAPEGDVPLRQRDTLGITEDAFQEQVIAYAHMHGWKVAHFRRVRVQRAGGETYWETPVAADGKGFPDLLLVKPGKQVALELKVGKNKPTPEQLEWLALFEPVSFYAGVIYPENWDVLVRVLGDGVPPRPTGLEREAV